jgi:dihydrofolate reductase
MKIVLIAAMDDNQLIGVDNTLPWKLSADLKRFKSLTMGHTIVMGRKTFESLGRPLPGRRHICLSRAAANNQLTPDERWPEQVFWCGDLSAALGLLQQEQNDTNSTLYIIGGAKIYAQALELADALEVTHIRASFTGDAFFPAFTDRFEKKQQEHGSENGLNYEFARYEKRSRS